jgi:hypothetical protein
LIKHDRRAAAKDDSEIIAAVKNQQTWAAIVAARWAHKGSSISNGLLENLVVDC